MIRRHAADTNTVYVQSAYLQAVTHSYLPLPDAGDTTICLNNSLANTGGFFCNFGGLFWVNPATGATSWFGSPQLGNKSAGMDQWGGNLCPIAWDQMQTTTPTWYCVIPDSLGKGILIQAQYTGGTSPPTQPRLPGGQINGYMPDSACQGAYPAYCISYGGGKLVFTDITPSSVTESITDQLVSFNTTFNKALCPNWPANAGSVDQQGVILTTCASLGQNTPGWLIAISPGDGNPAHAGSTLGAHIIGATNSFSGPALRWRGTHSLADFGEQPYFQFYANPYGQMVVTTNTSICSGGIGCQTCGAPGNSCDCGTYGGTHGNTCTLVQINPKSGSYEPYLQSPVQPFQGTPGELGPSIPGDTAAFCAPNGEIMTLIAKNYNGTQGSQVWQRGSPMNCMGGTIYFQPSTAFQEAWNPSSDSAGQNPIVDAEDAGGHGFWREGATVQAANYGLLNCTNAYFNTYQTRIGVYPTLPSVYIDYLSANPPFGGSGACFGLALPNDVQQHPNATGALAASNCGVAGQSPCAFDVRPLLGESQAPSPFSLVGSTGTLYELAWNSTPIDPDDLVNTASNGVVSNLNRKLVSTAASCGSHPLVDVSGPGSLIDGTAAKNYKYCIPRVAGECYSGSQVGQVYVNCPDVVTVTPSNPSCSGNGVHGGNVIGMGEDICVFNGSAPAQMAVQYELGASECPPGMSGCTTGVPGSLTRSLATSVGRVRMTDGFANARALPDNSWLLFHGDWLNRNGRDVWMGKLGQALPWLSTDSYNRSTFIPHKVTVAPPSTPPTITNAVIVFGYGENGRASQFYCTSRLEVCATSTSVPPFSSPQPFQFWSESPGGVACTHSTGCTIYIPAIPQRVLYFRVEYRDSSNNVVAQTAISAIAAK